MRRRPLFYFSAALILCLLTLALSLPYTNRTVKAQSPDPCVVCQGNVQQLFEQCETLFGGPNNYCYEIFNQGIIYCYATVCEQ
jgi:hypothetical protein